MKFDENGRFYFEFDVTKEHILNGDMKGHGNGMCAIELAIYDRLKDEELDFDLIGFGYTGGAVYKNHKDIFPISIVSEQKNESILFVAMHDKYTRKESNLRQCKPTQFRAYLEENDNVWT